MESASRPLVTTFEVAVHAYGRLAPKPFQFEPRRLQHCAIRARTRRREFAYLGEGMVVKPFNFISTGRRGVIQPAVKCRGKEYLRIIYGPEYTSPANMERLRSRGVAAKRSLALREFALGAEGLERFISREPLRRVHECVFGVLALESEPVDPRL